MGLDIRWPIGIMFSLIGAMMVIYGIFTSSNEQMYSHSLGINVNIIWGFLLLIFGATMLLLAWRGSKQPTPPPAKQDPGSPSSTANTR